MAKAKNTFKRYDCLVRLGGSRNNEVARTGVTAPEVMVLSAVHGADAVANVKASKAPAFDHSDAEERERLAHIYEGSVPSKRGFIGKLFGPATIPLPREHEAAHAKIEKVENRVVPPELADVVEPHAALIG